MAAGGGAGRAVELHAVADQLTSEAGVVRAALDRASLLIDDGRHAAGAQELRTVRRVLAYQCHPELLTLWCQLGSVGRRAGLSTVWQEKPFDRLLQGTVIDIAARRALTGDYDGSVRIWDVETEYCSHVLHGHDSEVNLAKPCADGRHAITGDVGPQFMCVWDLTKGRGVQTLTMSKDNKFLSLDPSMDSRLTIIGANDGPVYR